VNGKGQLIITRDTRLIFKHAFWWIPIDERFFPNPVMEELPMEE